MRINPFHLLVVGSFLLICSLLAIIFLFYKLVDGYFALFVFFVVWVLFCVSIIVVKSIKENAEIVSLADLTSQIFKNRNRNLILIAYVVCYLLKLSVSS